RLSPGHVNAQRTVNDRLPPERFQRHVESGKEDGLDQKGPTQLPEAGDQAAEINLGCEPHQDNEAGTRKSPVQRTHPPRLRFFQRFLHYAPPRRRVKRTSVLRLRGEFGTILLQCTAVEDQGLPPCSSGLRTRTLEQPHHSDVLTS